MRISDWSSDVCSSDLGLQENNKAIEARVREIEARARQLESELDASASLGDTIASAVSFAAAVSTEAALSAAFEATADETTRKQEAAREKRRHARQVRGTLAVPYFSFAQGLRRGSRSCAMSAVQWNDGAPIYRQLKERVIAMMLDGVLKPGDALPSVRQVAAEYQLNPITVSRAYQELADEALVEKDRKSVV